MDQSLWSAPYLGNIDILRDVVDSFNRVHISNLPLAGDRKYRKKYAFYYSIYMAVFIFRVGRLAWPRRVIGPKIDSLSA